MGKSPWGKGNISLKKKGIGRGRISFLYEETFQRIVPKEKKRRLNYQETDLFCGGKRFKGTRGQKGSILRESESLYEEKNGKQQG